MNPKDLIDYLKQHPDIIDAEFQSSVPIQDDMELIVMRIYAKDIPPPDLGVQVRDGVGVKMERNG